MLEELSEIFPILGKDDERKEGLVAKALDYDSGNLGLIHSCATDLLHGLAQAT